MHKIYFSFVFLILGMSGLSAQLPVYQWAKNLGGPSSDNGASIIVDIFGNAFTTGWFSGTADFDPGPDVYELTSVGETDTYIAKLDNNGEFEWAFTIGGTDGGYIEARALATDAFGNLYVTGMMYETIDFDPSLTEYNLSAGDYNNIFIAKFDPVGSLLWAKNILGDDISEGNDIAIDAAGNVYITGFFNGTSDFNPDPIDTYYLESESTGFLSTDIVILKLSEAGEFVWVKNIGGHGGFVSFNAGAAIAVNDEGVYTTGNFYGVADFDPGADIFELDAGAGPIAAAGYVNKLSIDGDFIWAKPYYCDLTIFPTDLELDTYGNIISVGYFDGTTDFDPDVIGESLISYSGFYSSYIAKLKPDGNFDWAKAFKGGDYNDCTLYGVTSDQLGNVYTTGYFTDPTDFDPNADVVNLFPIGFTDAFITKLSNDGDYLWAKNLGGDSAIVHGNDIAISSFGEIYSTGIFNKTVDFDPNDIGVAELTSNGTDDIYVHKLSLCLFPSEADLTINACSAYELNGVIYNESGDYTQELLTDEGCDSVINLHLTVTNIITGISLSEITLSALQDGASYQWINCDTGLPVDGAIDQSFTPEITGNYAVIVTLNECIDTSACRSVTVVGISESLVDDYKITPNPSSGLIFVTVQHAADIVVYNLEGEILLRQHCEANSERDIHLELLPNGIYVIQIKDEKSLINQLVNIHH